MPDCAFLTKRKQLLQRFGRESIVDHGDAVVRAEILGHHASRRPRPQRTLHAHRLSVAYQRHRKSQRTQPRGRTCVRAGVGRTYTLRP